MTNLNFLNNKVKKTILADNISAEEFLKIFSLIHEKYAQCYLFESLCLPRHQDRYHTIGFSPIFTLKAKENSLLIDGDKDKIKQIFGKTTRFTIKNINPYEYLKENFNFQYLHPSQFGGLIGYFSYESINYFEPFLNLKEHENFSNFSLGFYTDGLIFDRSTQELAYYHYLDNRVEEIKNIINQIKKHSLPTKLKNIQFLGHSHNKEEFINAVEHTKEKIRTGYSFQAEVGFKSLYNIKGNKLAIYNKLREVNPGPYMYFVKFDEEELLGSSPEILISNKDKLVLTTPTAGTRPRGKTKKEDAQLARELLNDPKEIAEHNMLVDLHRNDLARVCRASSVKVSDLMYLIKFSHVQHIVSNIIGLLRNNKDSYDLLASILPGGVVSGAPKIETIKIIDFNEQKPRGPYGGAIGRFSFNGDCDFCLPLRSLFCYNDECFAQTCAGIVYDSIPEKEYLEVNKKLAAMKETLETLAKPI